MATTYTTILGSDSLSDGRVKINANYLSIESDIEAVQTIADAKVAYSGTTPAVGDLVVAAATDGLSIKKKVFTASQVLESDSNGQPVSAAKGTAYNKNYGTTAGTTLQGDNDALYMKLAGTQTVTGDKTFSGVTIAPTQSQADNSTKVATTAYTDLAVSNSSATNSPNLITTDTTGYMTVDIPTVGAHWTYSGSPIYYFNGVQNTANGGATGYCTVDSLFGVTTDLKVKFTNKTCTLPSGTTSAGVWAFIGFLGQNPSSTADGDLANAGSRVGFVYYNGNLYALNANGSSITSTLISAYGTLVVDRFQINYTTTSVTFYRNGALVATHTTNIPTTQVRFGNSGVNGGGGGAGNQFSNIVFAQKRT